MLSQERRFYIQFLEMLNKITKTDNEEAKALVEQARNPLSIDLSKVRHPTLSGSEIGFTKVYQEAKERFNQRPNKGLEEPVRFALLHEAAQSLVEELSPLPDGRFWNGDDSFFDYIPSAIVVIKLAGDYDPDELLGEA